MSRPIKDPGSKPRIPWDEIATTLGYPDHVVMLKELYKLTGTEPMAQKLGISDRWLALKLRKLGVAMRPPGGPNNWKHGRYSKMLVCLVKINP